MADSWPGLAELNPQVAHTELVPMRKTWTMARYAAVSNTCIIYVMTSG